MTFKNVTRGLALGAAVAGLSLSADAQNGTNYHALGNGLDVVFGGVGAGGAQTAGDGVGYWIPGEDLRGATRDNVEGDYAYKQYGWREGACILSAPAGGGQSTLHYPTIVWTEFLGTGATGNTGHNPVVFTNPIDASCVSFPLGGTAGFVGYGVPAGSSANFLISGLPSALGSGAFIIPNENLVPSGVGASAFILAGANVGSTPIASTGFCWGSQFQWVPSALPSIKDATNGWWHWVANNPLGNQYWAFSGDEQNLYSSRTIASDAGVTALIAFFADNEYNAVSISVQPNTNLATSPAGFFAGGAYYTNTANVVDGLTGAPTLNINSGYDLGGHGTLSLTGTSGVPSANTGLGAQDPLGVGGVNPSGGPLVPSIGFHTYDTTSGDGTTGSKRITWLSVDLDHLTLSGGIGAGVFEPENVINLEVLAGTVKVPALSTIAQPGIQPTTIQLLGLFAHEAFACPTCSAGDPTGFPPGTFGIPDTQGASIQFPIPPLGTVCTPGFALPLTYGSSGVKGTAGVGASAGGLTWIQSDAATSGTKTFFIFD